MPIKHIAESKIEAAGILFFAQDTGRFLLICRAANVVDPSCWCGAGGKIEDGETPEEAARREVHEEIGFDTYEHDGEYITLFVHDSESLKFYNFLGVVPREFVPVLNWESAGYVWSKIENFPRPLHWGTDLILHDEDAKSKLSGAVQQAIDRHAEGNSLE